jgi:hypothetical protein
MQDIVTIEIDIPLADSPSDDGESVDSIVAGFFFSPVFSDHTEAY